MKRKVLIQLKLIMILAAVKFFVKIQNIGGVYGVVS